MKYEELKKAFKNKYIIRVAAGVVTVAVLGTGVNIYSVQAARENTKVAAAEEGKDSEEALKNVLSSENDSEDAGKEETVYVVADANGGTKEIIVSEWLKNKDGASTIEDASDLQDIENVKGNETFTQNGDKITWQADGNDIYYQGKADKELPISEKVTYYLDGKEMSAEEIAGKSGRVTIRFDYTNNEKTTQTVEGKTYEIYVPFAVMTGMICSDDFNNVEVTNGKVISDGEKKMVVGVAMPGLKESLELTDKDLNTDMEIPEYVEVSADVENFSLEMTMTVVMNDLLSDANLTDAFDLSGLEEDLDTLSDASGQLVDGSKELSDGTGTLSSGVDEFATGIGTLKNGILNYTNGASQLSSGINTLADSSGTLIDGVSMLNNSAATLNNGIEKLNNTLNAKMTSKEKASLIKQADDAIDATFKDSKNGTEAIKQQASSVFYNSLANNQGAKQQVAAGLGTYTDTVLKSVLNSAFSQVASGSVKKDQMINVKAQVVQEVSKQVVKTVTQQVTAGVTSQAIATNIATVAEASGGAVDAATVAAVCDTVNTAVNTEGSEAQQQINALIGQQDIDGLIAQNVNAVWPQYEAQIDAALQQPENQAQIQATVDTLVNQTVSQAMASETLQAGMSNTASQIVEGIANGAKDTVGTAVADTAKTAAKTAAESATITAVNGTKQQIAEAINETDAASGYSLVTGMKALSEGTQTMSSSMPTLQSGITQLKNGAATLVSNNDALTAGAGKLSDAVSQLKDGVKKLDDGSEELMDGMVKFDKDGIQKLTDTYDGDVKTLLNRLEAVTNAGDSYQTFTKAADGTKSSVKFILRTEGVKAE